jgi:hypothetical protein
MDNSKDWGEFLEGIKAAQQATEAQKEANEQHEKYERLRFEFTLAITMTSYMRGHLKRYVN